MGEKNLILNSTQIPNIILDQWLPNLSGAEFQVLMVIARQTYGWHKECDSISYDQLRQKTGLGNGSIGRATKSLKEKGYIATDGTGPGVILAYKINITSPKMGYNLSQNGTPKMGDTKETNTKETLTKVFPLSSSPLKKITLESLTEEDVGQIAEDYHVPVSFVRLQLEKMSNWLGASGKTYKDYKKALRNWVLRDAEKLVERRMGDPTKRSIDARNL